MEQRADGVSSLGSVTTEKEESFRDTQGTNVVET